MLKAGIVGLPNVGKSTLFNAVVRARKAAAENFPFCTIEPNLGVVTVQDPRLVELGRIAKVSTLIPTTIEFVDIAGLVKGASQGEGLGNQFLGHIRDVDALVHVVRCFEDPDIHHVNGAIDPKHDIELVQTELLLADLQTLQKRQEKIARDLKRHDKHAEAEQVALQRFTAHLESGNPASTLDLHSDEMALGKDLCLLTAKPTLFVANVKEGDLVSTESNRFVSAVTDFARSHQACATVTLSAQLEIDLVDLAPSEAKEYLEVLAVKESGIDALIHATYRLLGLRTFFTFNDKESRAWTIRAGTTAPKAAGTIHTDFEHGFIKAETVALSELIECGSISHARDRGRYRMEGKDYVVRDGDVIHFKFHV